MKAEESTASVASWLSPLAVRFSAAVQIFDSKFKIAAGS
jgi:hypothetical protein